MIPPAGFLILGVLWATVEASWPSTLPRCSKECPITQDTKLHYETHLTYTYAYSGMSRLTLTNVPDSTVEVNWKSFVKLSILGPCDIAISIINPSVEGFIDEERARLLEVYPLVVAMTDGRVQSVCSHADDDTWSVNLKKGIASALQNTLPSNSTANSGLTFTEVDVVGKCPTVYNIEAHGDDTIFMLKTKNHRFCQERYPTPDELPIAWLKAPLPVGKSSSFCRQEISNGIYISIKCDDINVFRPAYGMYKYVTTRLHSELHFVKKARVLQFFLSSLPDKSFIHKTLHYDYQTARKNVHLLAHLDEIMKELCENTRETVERDSANLMAKGLHLLRTIPQENVEMVLQKIRSGHYCSSYHRLESLFLDALAFIREPSAVKLMVQELITGKASFGRNALYTAAFYLTARPNKASIEALQPLFASGNPHISSATLGASVMVGTYCRHHSDCDRDSSITRLAELLGRLIQETCSSSSDESIHKEALGSLKALGNIGVMTPKVTSIVLSCLQEDIVENYVRVSAAQAFRNVNCKTHATKSLVEIAINPNEDTEIRIESYLAATKCAKSDDFQLILSKIVHEHNNQVRGFILSHLSNLKTSSAPHKEETRYHITNIVLPYNFTCDIKKYSRNIDLSYYNPSLGLGFGMESNVIYTPGSYIPRSVNLNLTSSVGGTIVNMGEYGARVEGLEPILEDLFGPDGYLRKSTLKGLFKALFSVADGRQVSSPEDLGNDGVKVFGWSQLSQFLDKIYKRSSDKLPKVDLYARLNDQEATYATFTGNPLNIDFDRFIKTIMYLFKDSMLRMTNVKIDKVHMGQINLEYDLPTIQGMPLKLKFEATGVGGLEMENHFTNIEEHDAGVIMKLKPSISLQMDGFVGYDSLLSQCGLRTKNIFTTNNGLSVAIVSNKEHHLDFKIDLPRKMELLAFQSETYLMKMMGRTESKILPQPGKNIRMINNFCLDSIESLIGLRLCYHINIPDVFRSTVLPLGSPAVAKLFIEKSEPGLEGYFLKTIIQNAASGRTVNVHLVPVGASSVIGAKGNFTFVKCQESMQISGNFRSEGLHGEGKFDFLNIDYQKGISVFLHLKTDNIDISKGVKLELIESSEYNQAVNIYISPDDQFSAESQIFAADFLIQKSGNEVSVDFMAGSKNDLVKHLDVNMQIGVDLRRGTTSGLLLPNRLRVFEFHANYGSWKLLTFIRLVEESEYSTTFQVFANSIELVSITGKHSLGLGTENTGLRTENYISGTFGHDSYKVLCNLDNMDTRRGILLKIADASNNKSFAHFEVLHTSSETLYTTVVRVDMPSYMEAINFEGTATANETNVFQIAAKLRHGHHFILHVEGPVTLILTSKVTQIQTDCNIVAFGSRPHTFTIAVIFSKSKQVLSLGVKSGVDPMFDIGWNMENLENRPVSFGFQFEVNTFWSTKINVLLDQHFLHVSLDNVVLPDTQDAIRSKGYVDVDATRRKASAELSWDAGRDPARKVSAEVSVDSISTTVRQSTLSGGWKYMEHLYHFKTELDIKDPHTGFSGVNIMKTVLTTPYQKTISVGLQCKIQRTSDIIKVDIVAEYKSDENKELKLITETNLSNFANRFNYQLTNAVTFMSPEGQRTKLYLEVKRQIMNGLGEVLATINLEAPTLPEPVEVEFKMIKQPHSFNTVWNIELDTPAKGFSLDFALTPARGLQIFDVSLDLGAIKKLLQSVNRLLKLESPELYSSDEESQEMIYHIRYDQTSEASTTITVQVPSRVLLCEAEISSEGHTYRIFPNREKSGSNYEMSLKKTSNWGPLERGLAVQGRFRHSRMTKDMQIDVGLYGQEEGIIGKLELDIFPNPDDKITGVIASIRTSEVSMKIEARLTGKILKGTPRLISNIALSPNTKAFDFSFYTVESQIPSTFIATKVDRISDKSTAVSVRLSSEELLVMQVGKPTSLVDGEICEGLEFTGALRSHSNGHYNITAHTCLPGGMRMRAQSTVNDWTYIMHLGMLGQRSAEMSIKVKHPVKREEKPVVMTQAILESSQRLALDLRYRKKQLNDFRRAAVVKWHRTSEDLKHWLMKTCFEVFTHDAESIATLAKMDMMWQDIKEEMSQISHELVEDVLILKKAVDNYIFKNGLVAGVLKKYFVLRDQITLTMHHVSVVLAKIVGAFSVEFDDFLNVVKHAAKGAIYSVQTGNISEALRNLQEMIEMSNAYKILHYKVEEAMSSYPEQYDSLRQTLSMVVESLRLELVEFSDYINHIPEVQRNIDWLLHHLDFERWIVNEAEEFLYRRVQDAVLLSLELEPNSVHLSFPLRSPANSLLQAVPHVSFNPIPILDSSPWTYIPTKDELMWEYYSFFPWKFIFELPPYNRTAMLIGRHEILTFDGTVLRAPSSPCKVLLLAYKDNTLAMEHPNTQAPPRLSLEACGIRVVINPDYNVVINDQDVNFPYIVQGDIRVWKTPTHINVTTPSLTLYVSTEHRLVSVELNGWAYGQVAGLLGTYDGEIGNDMLMSSGTKATSLQELVKSWHEDQDCKVPDISPANYENTPIIQVVLCRAMLGIATQCNAVINPEFFMNICYGTHNICDAIQALRSLCSIKEVLGPLAYAC